MRPSAFSYSRPATIAQILEAMRHGAVPLAGGQSLLPAMRLRQAAPPALVDLAAAVELSAAFEFKPEILTIGAQVTHAQCAADERINSEYPWLAQAASFLGDVQVRNRGTVVGNLCWADARANFAVAMLASDARVHYRDPAAPTDTNAIAIEGFFTGFRQHAAVGRLVTHLTLPRIPGRRGTYREFSRQRQDLALVNVCVVLGPDYARVVVGGIHQTPVRVPFLETRLRAGVPPATELSVLIEQVLSDMILAPLQDAYGTPAFKLQLAKVELRRALETLTQAHTHA